MKAEEEEEEEEEAMAEVGDEDRAWEVEGVRGGGTTSSLLSSRSRHPMAMKFLPVTSQGKSSWKPSWGVPKCE